MRSRANEQEQQHLLNSVCSSREAVLGLYSKKQCAEDKHQQNGRLQSITAHKSTLAASLCCCYHYQCFLPSLLESNSDAGRRLENSQGASSGSDILSPPAELQERTFS